MGADDFRLGNLKPFIQLICVSFELKTNKQTKIYFKKK